MYLHKMKLRYWCRLLVCFFRAWFILPANDGYRWETDRLGYDIKYLEDWNWVYRDTKR
jgi:hypothetical protein